MKTSNEEIDQIIHDALSEEEAAFYDQLGEQSLIESTFMVYKGRNKWISVIVTIFGVLFFVAFVYATVIFFQSDDIKTMLRWMAIGFASLGANQIIKLWHWLQVDKNVILREMKRLEFQISVLATAINKKSGKD
ncbi:hypothetical protein FNH22_16580 [Fulvivirga sp. M361]|uniref:DUF6768 family protein n=1 Tax=Fulvivirga sp. M361 TaxID=2594266 RepID=UPI00117B0B18|nr:DUF6768 family protein [Fulvivirga sp. M361]TRX56254.1 hypothetical protein FNH22_16580 [Fulvivirga sp. M361]